MWKETTKDDFEGSLVLLRTQPYMVEHSLQSGGSFIFDPNALHHVEIEKKKTVLFSFFAYKVLATLIIIILFLHCD